MSLPAQAVAVTNLAATAATEAHPRSPIHLVAVTPFLFHLLAVAAAITAAQSAQVLAAIQ
ncbi:MAG: hypothetical protein CL844_05075 [Crocinitomicaceae bacterium]|nr:hypothetical protein [Crocinitomicaceae bacterium]